jgi:uncharacterized membrane protein
MAQVKQQFQKQQVPLASQSEGLDKQARLWRTDRILLYVAVGLCIIGLGIAGYLTYLHYTGDAIPCVAGGGCETVQKSQYSNFFGIPVALLGLFSYLVLLALTAGRLRLSLTNQTNGRYRLDVALFLVNLACVAFSAYLTSTEAFLINAWCIWCLGSAITLTIMLFVNGYRLWVNHFSADAPLN